MKVLLFNGSPRANGCTFTALSEIAGVLGAQGIETELLQIGNKPVQDCIGCGGCAGKGKCVFADDCVNEWIEKAKAADGFVFGTPVYYAHPSGRILSTMDRMFYAGGANFAHKPAAVIASARRAGTTATLDAISKHLSISQMPVISSSYWNMVHGNSPEEVRKDAEGMETMRNLGLNLAWIVKSIEAGKQAGVPAPQTKKTEWTNFIR
ncbi:MAG: flavodoxin family protein [Clostridiales bacterium]|nr:flavodoxin family protein [Clostridiales bacterium]